MTKDLLNDAETSEMLGISPATIRSWRVHGKGPKFLKIGGNVRYRRATVEAWLVAQERTSTSDQPEEHAAA